MYIPSHLYITQQGPSKLPCIQYVCHLSGKKQTVDLCISLAQKAPHRFRPEHLTYACLNVDNSQLCIEIKNAGQQINILESAVPNIPSSEWQYLGTDGRNSYIIHPSWGVWSFSNKEYLCLTGNSFSKALELQFYVKNNVLYLGVANELRKAMSIVSSTQRIPATALTSKDLGAVVKYGRETAIILKVSDEHIRLMCIPQFESYTIPKQIPVFDNGNQLQILEFDSTKLHLPLLTQFVNTQPYSEEHTSVAVRDERERLIRHILAFQLEALLQELLQLSKSISLTWDCQIPSSPDPRKHMLVGYTMYATPGLKLLCESNSIEATPSGLRISISKKANNKYRLLLSFPEGQIAQEHTLEELVLYLNLTLEIQNLTFKEGHTVVWITP